MTPHINAPLRQLLLDLEHDVLKIVATDQDLVVAMNLLCRRVEEISPAVICSILTVDDSGVLHPLAAPSLPDAYSNALDGICSGPDVGSCGTAAYLAKPVEVVDIETDPLWRNFKALALPLGLRACWSSPIKARDGRVIGTFAFYYRTPRGAGELDQQIVEACVHLCAIAVEHERARAQIHRMAYYDAVTGLPNRAAFHDRATAMIGESAATGTPLGFHYIDLDDFKGVNDTLGHRVGDLLLRSIGERLCAVVAPKAVVARLGGDEFAVLQADATPLDTERLAWQILASFDEPFAIEDHLIAMAASIGIARMPADGTDLTDLMKNADLALYRAKGDGRRHLCFYAPEMSEAVRLRREHEVDLRKAVEAGDFALVYQPIVNLASGAVTGCEALIRWQHPVRGTVLPAEFIAMAEEMGLIPRIGEWVLDVACKQAATWPSNVGISINLSPVQLKKPSFALGVAKALADSGIAPHRLELEITESVILADNPLTHATLRQLRAMGVRVALDDFGTGYSSLRSLQAFPIDRIKIDKSFVHELGQTAHSTSIVRTVVALARDLGMTTTAEGVETHDQYVRLVAEGCTEGQGYYFSYPQNAEEIGAVLRVDRIADPKGGRQKAASQ